MSLIEVVHLHAWQLMRMELAVHASIPARVRAQIEIHLSPRESKIGEQRAPAILARMELRGMPEEDPQSMTCFTIRIERLAVFQPMQGKTLDSGVFKARHTELARSLYPRLREDAQMALDRIGVSSLRLPLELLDAPQPAQAATPAPAPNPIVPPGGLH